MFEHKDQICKRPPSFYPQWLVFYYQQPLYFSFWPIGSHDWELKWYMKCFNFYHFVPLFLQLGIPSIVDWWVGGWLVGNGRRKCKQWSESFFTKWSKSCESRASTFIMLKLCLAKSNHQHVSWEKNQLGLSQYVGKPSTHNCQDCWVMLVTGRDKLDTFLYLEGEKKN
jgi:hypothetical protein